MIVNALLLRVSPPPLAVGISLLVLLLSRHAYTPEQHGGRPRSRFARDGDIAFGTLLPESCFAYRTSRRTPLFRALIESVLPRRRRGSPLSLDSSSLASLDMIPIGRLRWRHYVSAVGISPVHIHVCMKR